jgi:hypothetical protein
MLTSCKKAQLKALQFKLGVANESAASTDYKHIPLTKPGFDIDQGPCCETGKKVKILHFSGERGPPMLPKLTVQALVPVVI